MGSICYEKNKERIKKYYQEHKDEIKAYKREYAKRWREAHPERMKEINEYAKIWRKNNKEERTAKQRERYANDLAYRELHKQCCKNYWKNSRKEKEYKDKIAHPEKYIFKSARDRAKHHNIPFNITVDDIHIPEKCPYLDIKLSMTNGLQNQPSIDKIIPEKGYVKDNIRIISYRANACKNNLSIEEMKTFAKNINLLHP